MQIKGIGVNIDTKRTFWRLKNLEEELKLYKSIGFDYAEVPAHGVGVIIGGHINRERLEIVKEMLGSFDMRYTVHGPDQVNLRDFLHPNHKDTLRATIEFAAAIGSEIVVYHVGRPLINYPAGVIRQYKEEVKALRELADFAADRGVKIGVENLRDPDEAISVIEATGKDNVGLTLDVGHLFLWCKEANEDYIKTLKDIAKYAIHLHVHDNFGGAVEEMSFPFVPRGSYVDDATFGLGDLHLVPGMGAIPFDKVFDVLAEANYSGVVMLEIGIIIDEVGVELKKGLEFIKRLINERTGKKEPALAGSG